jgi:hydroxymethylpyrimidine/phosphomethylpyrimidine kinase
MQRSRFPSQRQSRSVLTIAGSDSGGGAGIQADLRTFAAFGIHGTSAITAVTAQNTRGVTAIHPVPTDVVVAQIIAVLGDFRVGSIKIGMLATPAIARAVAAVLARYPHIPVVLDPVMVATTGASLGRGNLAVSFRRHWFASADLLTPNIPEAERLLDRAIGTSAQMRKAAGDLIAQGARAVLLKGWHLRGRGISDLLLTKDGEHWFHHPRIRGEGHGTGCTLSAAIAAGLALGLAMEPAVERAIGYVHDALAGGYRPGKGPLVVLDHFADMRMVEGVDSA